MIGAIARSLHTPEYSRLREQLRLMREEARLTQRDLAERLKVPPSWVAKVERGERRLDLIEFTWICSACNQNPAAVLTRILHSAAGE